MSAAENYLETISTLESEVTALTGQVQAFRSDQGGAAKRVLTLLEEKRAIETRAQQLSESNREFSIRVKQLEELKGQFDDVLKRNSDDHDASLSRIRELEERGNADAQQVEELRKLLASSAANLVEAESEKARLQSIVTDQYQQQALFRGEADEARELGKKRDEDILLARALIDQHEKEIEACKALIEDQSHHIKRLEEELRHSKEELQIESSALRQTEEALRGTIRELEDGRNSLLVEIAAYEQRQKEASDELEARAAGLREADKKLTETLVHNRYLSDDLAKTQAEHRSDRDSASLQAAELKNMNLQSERAVSELREQISAATQQLAQNLVEHQAHVSRLTGDHQDEVGRLQESSQKQLSTLQTKNLSLEADLAIEREEKTKLDAELRKKQEEDAGLQMRILKIREELSMLRQHLEKSKEDHANQVAILESDFDFQRKQLEGKVEAQKVEVTRQLELAQIRVFEAADSATKKERTLQQQFDALRAENLELVERCAQLEKRNQEQQVSLNIVNREHREVRAVAIDLQNRIQKIDIVHKQDLDKQTGYIQELQQRFAGVSASQVQIEKMYQTNLVEYRRLKDESEKVISELRQEVIGLKVKLRTREKAFS